MFLKLRIWWIKRKARNAYVRMAVIESRYNCGKSMMQAVNPEYSELSADVKRYCAELKRIDPEFPAYPAYPA